MTRKNYPWNIPNIKFGSNIAVNIILFIGILVFYAITGLAYLILLFIDWVKTDSSKKETLSGEVSEIKSPDCGSQLNYKIVFVGFICIIVSLYGIFRYSKYNSFPIYIKSTKHTKYENTYGKYHNFLNNRTGGINPIFWETSISWEKTKYDLRNISTTPIIFQNVKLDAEVELYYGEHSSWESKLEAIHLKIPYKPDLESDLINYYGKKYIHMYYPKTGYYHNTWLFDKHYVSIERRCNNRENDYLYIRINRLNYIYYDYGKQKYLGLGDGAYFESKVKQQNGVYADSIANLSFHNIALGKHKNEVLSHIKNSPNVLNIIKYKSSEYGARVQEVMPENNIRIDFNTKLVFYRDTLCYLQITSNDKNAELYTTLLIEKYKSKNADKGGIRFVDLEQSEDAHRTQRTHFEWFFKNQSIELTELIDHSKIGKREYKGVKIEYRQNILYDMWQEDESLRVYENKLKRENERHESLITD